MNISDQITLLQIEDAQDFWTLFDELKDDNSKFVNNRVVLLHAFKTGNLYGLQVEETEDMLNPIFCKDGFLLLPCLCVVNKNMTEIIWTHTRARNNGFASKLVELLKIESVYNPLPQSIGFWQKNEDTI